MVESGDILAEYDGFDNRMKNDKFRKKFDKIIDGVDPISKIPYRVSIGPERFLAPEMFFNPEIIDEKYRQPVD